MTTNFCTHTEEQLRILRHMLGIDDSRKRNDPYRDYYCANPGDESLLALERMGAVRRYAERDGYHWYCTTEQGRAAAIQSAKQMRKQKSARVYVAFLDCRDAFPDLTFKQFITAVEFKEARARA